MMVIPNKNNHAGFAIIDLVISIAIIVVCISLILPCIQRARNKARRTQCKNNLKQIATALHNYHDTHACFPPGWVSHTPDTQSKSAYGWQALILPFLNQALLYGELDIRSGIPIGEEAFGRRNRVSTGEKTIISTFRCSADTTAPLNTMRGGWGTSNYSGSFGSTPVPRIAPNDTAYYWAGSLITPIESNGIFCMNSNIRFRDITDGSSNTIMLGERSIRSAAGIWAGVRSNSVESDQVTDSSFGNEINSNPGAFSSLHPQGALVCFADGRVKFLSEYIDSKPIIDSYNTEGVFQKLADRQNDEVMCGEDSY